MNLVDHILIVFLLIIAVLLLFCILGSIMLIFIEAKGAIKYYIINRRIDKNIKKDPLYYFYIKGIYK